ncbi:3,4-dihydroxy 2-butanone 4-phosphate synthase / GTP cyclohydrolase II [Pseudonocardia thermophila]|uniref:3,4-dihydroxy-2-butanone-4-phosphate synthase n=1 Tax=Pseudonocardia thermophila TaxID=1848 RepID=A0A1M7BB08_PSETH|nr:3,4-dihydroxy-2-butanone-4-phosphate synthase [Pseudonocardia thermophila]SHL52117.1 3,4-dihydroxy 2-butanone 4-phosphate synthase / GTP cyclohydrolase II [Pseudonocardia thermophila]
MGLLRSGCPERARAAVEAVAAGRPVVLVGDAGRAGAGDIVFAATVVTPALVGFTVRHTSGFVCVALPAEACDRLGLDAMHPDADGLDRGAFRVTVDLNGTGTGISAAARAATIAALGSPASVASDFTRPGHVVPLQVQPGGVLGRPGRAEAACDLAQLADLPAAGALCEIVSQDRPGELACGAELERFAAEHDLVVVHIADVVALRRRSEPQVRRVVQTALPTVHGRFTAIGYASIWDAAEHLALVAGPVDPAVPVHVHVECLTGDVLRATACPCRRELDDVMRRFAEASRGIVVYVRPAGLAGACALRRAEIDRAEVDRAGVAATVQWILADLGAAPAARPEPVSAPRTRARRSTSGRRAACPPASSPRAVRVSSPAPPAAPRR